ncbi:aminopeptidase [Anaerolentibacter hominis]|uniref:aminopeptidase n=1 Tax=Anaerolentibacter hominis TaxID=3079009 RepID=UPI0031B886C8
MKKKMLKKYAKLIVRVGANVQKGQGVMIDAATDQKDLVACITEEAYKAGAAWVLVDWGCQEITKLVYQYETTEQLSLVPKWREEKYKMQVEELPCRIHIVSEDPDGLNGLDQEKLQKASVSRHSVLKPYIDALENRYQWVIAAAPSKAWAKKVYPGVPTKKAVTLLWEEIFKAVHLTPDNDPVKAWKKHNENFKERCEWLNNMDFESISYKSKNGTDFTVWMIPGARWMGGGENTMGGQYFNPNMPTEEIFTTPMRGRAEGKVVATKPLSYQGQLIEDFSMTFENGRVVKAKAKKGEAALKTMLSMDEGASMLGEVALVPHDSPISNSGVMFYETLFDENASCHLAVGRGFSNVLPDYETLNKEQQGEKGINDSMIHVDFMIGSRDMEITGHTKDGIDVPIFKKGNWAFSPRKKAAK